MLTKLRVLDLSSSSFSGDVPLELSHLSNLVSLHISQNLLSFSNVVMNQLVRNLTKLWDFELTGSNLSNIAPTSFMNLSLSLAYLKLSFCSLHGNFPDHILGLPNLRVLRVNNNPELNGHLPMSNWSRSLEILVLSQTNFLGGIPNCIGEAKALRYLDLSYCSFSGEIPESIGMAQVPNCVFNFTTEASSNSFANVCLDTLSNLFHLNLRHNSFTGAIPSWIYFLPNLKNLGLGGNHFFGFIKDFRSNSIESLYLSYTNFQGKISESLYKQVNLTSLYLGSTNLSGVLNLDILLRTTSLRFLDISNSSQLSIFSTNASSSNLVSIFMASLNLEEIPNFLRYHKSLQVLDLSNNQIVGKIPEWFSKLDGMEYFHVSNNVLSGNVHTSICQATSLSHLDLSNNSLSGVVPSCLSNMTNLYILALKRNNFSGVIPIPPNIWYYIASENQFIGEIPLTICNPHYLQILSLSNNHMSGKIPPCLTNSNYLSVLDLKSNNFSGIIVPTTFSRRCELTSLDLNDNQIEGELPQSLLYCENLQVLDLGKNKITGYFPYWLKAALEFRVLILRSNRFYGHINNSFNKDSFTNLRIIDLSHNNFNGPLPSSLFKNMKAIKGTERNKTPNSITQGRTSYYYHDSIVLSTKGFDRKFETILLILKTIDLASNEFNGEIPKEIGVLKSLVLLNLSHNKLTGEIPLSLSNLKNLESLDLSSNELLGNIPPQLAALTFLSFLNLSQNQLTGPIPQTTQFGTFENSYFGNPGLCGFPLPKCGADQKDPKSQVLYEEGDSLEKGIGLKAVFMGYGCGMVFGVSMGYLVFQFGKPMWIVATVEGIRAQNIKTSWRRSRKA